MRSEVASPVYSSGVESRITELSRTNLPLTVRGFVVLLFLFYLLIEPVARNADIIAALIACSVLALLCAVAIITVVIGQSLQRNLTVSIFPPQDQEDGKITARELVPLVVRLSRAQLFPFFILSLRIEFRSGGLQTATHAVTGSLSGDELLIEPIAFPHRGTWQIQRVGLSFGDRLGFARFRWNTSNLNISSVTVSPPLLHDHGLPVLSSSQRPGDDVLLARERQGDPYDLKPYHPADGMKKILWKVYAKSGQLISRHPESSMTPEGQVLIYAFASRRDDSVAAWASSYMHSLESLNLEVLFGCEGMGSNAVVRSAKEAGELLIETVWQTRSQISAATSSQEILRLIEQGEGKNRESQVSSVLIFVSNHRLSIPSNTAALQEISRILESRGISPVLCALEEVAPLVPEAAPRPLGSRIRAALAAPLSSWFVFGYLPQAAQSGASYQELLNQWSRKNWGVYTHSLFDHP